MEESNYWQRLAKRRLSRRRLLASAAAAGTGLAALSLIGCDGDGGEAPATATGAPSPTTTSPPGFSSLSSLECTEVPWEPMKEGCRGGIHRRFDYESMPIDTYDPHQTQSGPAFNLHGAVFSKVLKYDDTAKGIIEPDLAEAMPEVPDELTYIVKIRPDVRFHNTEKARKDFPEVAGRQLTTEDVKYSIERQLNKESPRATLYYRMSQWETLDKIEVIDPLTIRLVTKQPTAPFMHYLADNNAFVIARELVDPAKDDMNQVDKMIGTGPFVLDKLVSLQVMRCLRNPDWFAKNDRADIGLPDRPIIDGFESIWPPSDDTSCEIAFKSKQVDRSDYVDLHNVDRIAQETGARIFSCPSVGWINSRLLVNDSPNATTPFKDLRLRQAINIAVDRNHMSQQIFLEWGLLCGPVHPAVLRWALPAEELAKKPGYRFSRQERDKDLVDAKAMWEAAGGPDIGTLEILYCGIPDWTTKYWPQLQRELKETLGLETKGRVDATGYTEMLQSWFQKRLIFSYGYDNGYLELDDWLYPYFHSTGAKNSFNLNDPKLDQLLEAQRRELDYERRQQLGFEIQHYLLDEVAARLDWVSFADSWTVWPYEKNARWNLWYGYTYHWANMWLDRTDPSFQGRPD
jgi:ABC-type transport system substrate-binding protein